MGTSTLIWVLPFGRRLLRAAASRSLSSSTSSSPRDNAFPAERFGVLRGGELPLEGKLGIGALLGGREVCRIGGEELASISMTTEPAG